MPDLTATAGSDRPSLLPAYLDAEPSEAFDRQLRTLRELAGNTVGWLDPVPLQSAAPRSGAAALILEDVSGAAYRQLEAFRAIEIPVLVLTSDFGTMAMWDWETRLPAAPGRQVMSPTPWRGQDGCRALRHHAAAAARSSCTRTTPERGKQPAIFKRFYWWEDECSERIREKFGLRIYKRSFAELGPGPRPSPTPWPPKSGSGCSGPGPGGRPDQPGHAQRPQALPGRP